MSRATVTTSTGTFRSGWCNGGPTDRCWRCPGEGPSKSGVLTCRCACHVMPPDTATPNKDLAVG